MDEKRINELTAKVATLRGEIAHAAAECAKVGGDPKMVGVTAAEVAAGLEEAVREVKRYRGILRGLGACIGSAYDLLPEQFRPEIRDGDTIADPAQLARLAIREVIHAGIDGDAGADGDPDWLKGMGYMTREQAIDRHAAAHAEDEEERPASSKTEPAPPLEEFTPDILSVDKLPDGDPSGLPFDSVPDDPAKVLGASAKADAAYDPNDATVKGRKRAAEAEVFVSEWTPSTALISELGLDAEWAKGEGLALFRTRVDQTIRLARWGHRFKAWVLANPDQVKRKAS